MFFCEYSVNFKNIYFEKRRKATATTVNNCSWMSLTLKLNIVNFNLVETMQFWFYRSKQEILSQLNWRTW